MINPRSIRVLLLLVVFILRRLSLVVGFAIYYAQVIFSQLAFLQSDKEDTKKKKKKITHLSLNNRFVFLILV